MKINHVLFFLCVLLLGCGCGSVSNNVSLENKRVVFIGDSITHGGRYVSYIEYYLQKNNPQSKYDIISVGLGSETVSGLSEKDHPFPRPCVHTRLDDILRETKPEILFACYGMNDGIYHPQSPERFQAYKDGYDLLISKAKAAGVKQVVLLTPPPYDSVPIRKKTIEKGEFGYKTPYVNYNDVLSDYAKYLLSMNKSDVAVVDLNSALVNYVNEKRKSAPQFTLSRDGIHPGSEGHLLMAQTVLRGIGLNFNFISPSSVQEIDNDDFFKLINKKRSKRSNGWLNYIGYTRGKVVKSDSIKEVEIEVFELQKQIDSLQK
ncbi:MAG: SGNH/GDSL hydrolase family protein [Lentisphaeraceae bacterium]|nr:SGNH/GDSL hydrolase family protein [Lentisphaeraceae bacterium]